MDARRWVQIENLFHQMVDLPGTDRAQALEQACGEDHDLKEHVQQLLDDDAVASEFMDEMEFLPKRRSQEPSETDPPESDPRLNQQIGAYRLASRIALGGMGLVYRAERSDGLFENEVAVKLIREDAATPEGLRNFERERRTLASLEHPNIARLLDGGATPDGVPYLVMELIRGVPIDEYVDRRRLPIRDRLQLFLIVCDAVQFAHQNLVIHRDLKPSNILIDDRGTAKLLDFGIARLADGEQTARDAESDRRMLTPEYASPEQLRGSPLTTSSDVFSLGLILFRLLTGRRPPERGLDLDAPEDTAAGDREPTRPSAVVMEADHRGTGPRTGDAHEHAARRGTTPRRLQRQLSGDLDHIAQKALAPDPGERYLSVRQLAADIERYLSHRPVKARRGGLLYRFTKFSRRNRFAITAVVVILIAHSFGYVSTWKAERRAAREADHARIEADSFQQITRFLMNSFLSATSSGADRDRAQQHVAQQADRVRRQYPKEPHLRANLVDALGQVSMRLDLLDDAEALIREAMATRRTEFGEDSLETALSLGSLGSLQYRRGEFDLAVKSFDAALQLHLSCPQDVHTDVARAINDLAVALRNAGRTDEATPLHREALAMRREAFGDDSLPVAESLNNLAAISLYAGDREEAADHLREAHAIRQRILGPAHPLSLQVLSNLAVTTFQLGDTNTCMQLLKEAIAGYRVLKTEGEDGLARVLRHVATVALQASDLDAAEAALRESHAIQTRRLGPTHPELASIQSSIAILLHRRGQDDEAHQAWRDSLEVRRTALSEDHPSMGNALNDYGHFLVEIEAYDQAETALRRALQIHEANLPDDHPSIGAVSMNLGVCLFEVGEADQAIEALRRAIAVFEQALGEDSPQCRTAVQILADITTPVPPRPAG